ncbi:hypothetical protein L1887_57060 [Cichorium endivia]|nr:hypothetical protein L1887_57060 [Cichorium endivia]
MPCQLLAPTVAVVGVAGIDCQQALRGAMFNGVISAGSAAPNPRFAGADPCFLLRNHHRNRYRTHCHIMTPTATSGGAGDDIATFDPFANVRSFKYSGSINAVYPLSPKPKIPPSIRRPNYAREGVRMWLEFWWQVRIPLLTVALPVFARPRHADALPWSTLFALLLLGLALDSLKQFLESRNIKVNTQADQDGVRKSATLAREVLEIAASHIKPGVTTDEIDKVVFAEAIKRDCYPSPLGYHGYPKSVCTYVALPVTSYLHTLTCSYSARCLGLSQLGQRGHLPRYSRPASARRWRYPQHRCDALPQGLPRRPERYLPRRQEGRGGCRVHEAHQGSKGMPRRCDQHLRSRRPLWRDWPRHPAARRGGRLRCGQELHRSRHLELLPRRTHHLSPRHQEELRRHEARHIFTIEPMLNLGSEWRDLSWPDDWTVATVDGARSAAAEETLLITETGVEILTAKGGPRHIDTTERRKQLEEQIRAREERKKRRKLDNSGADTPASGAATPTPAPEDANPTTASTSGPTTEAK